MFVRNWISSFRVRAMSGDAVKSYVYLLCRSWLEVPRATLPTDDNTLASMAEVTIEKWQQLKSEVMQHFKEGKCDEHKGRFYNEFLLEISRKYENNQRFNNKNANKTRIHHKKNASVLYNANANANDNTQEKILKKNKIFVPPSLDEFSKYFTDNGFPVELAKRAFEGYAAADWYDSQGHKIRNWKQKAQHVWFKEDAKIKSYQSAPTHVLSAGEKQIQKERMEELNG